jgi:hypothetical protein
MQKFLKHCALFLSSEEGAVFSGLQCRVSLWTPQPIELLRSSCRNCVWRGGQWHIRVRPYYVVCELENPIRPDQRDRMSVRVIHDRQPWPLHCDLEIARVGVSATVGRSHMNRGRRAARKYTS